MSDENKRTLEERFEALDKIIEQMEQSGVSLDQSFDLYKAGLEEVKACNSQLDAMEATMAVLNKNGDLEEF